MSAPLCIAPPHHQAGRGGRALRRRLPAGADRRGRRPTCWPPRQLGTAQRSQSQRSDRQRCTRTGDPRCGYLDLYPSESAPAALDRKINLVEASTSRCGSAIYRIRAQSRSRSAKCQVICAAPSYLARAPAIRDPVRPRRASDHRHDRVERTRSFTPAEVTSTSARADRGAADGEHGRGAAGSAVEKVTQPDARLLYRVAGEVRAGKLESFAEV